ncbi:hypothetical protein ALP75_203579 [Pseudomonas syringae pv. actinidiae]|nr:hypothetical protein ALP75_203579 [Pseudomonas syringae pv. actinidiae]
MRLAIGRQNLPQPLHAEQLIVTVAGVEHAIGQQKYPVTRCQRVNLGARIESVDTQHAQRQMTGCQRHMLAVRTAQQIAIRQAAVPHLDLPLRKVDAQQRRAAEHVDRQNALELGIHFTKDLDQAIALGGHAVEHIGKRHGPNGRRQTMAGEIPEQHLHMPGRGVGSQHQITVEQRIRRLQITNIARPQTSGVRHLIEYGLGNPLLIEQVFVVFTDLVTLQANGFVQYPQAVHGIDLGSQYQRVVRLGHEIIATGVQTARQRFTFGQRGEKDDRHQRFARQRLDPSRRFKAIHDRHHRVHQNQLRAFGHEDRHRLDTIGRTQHSVALTRNNGRKKQPVTGAVVGNQNAQFLQRRLQRISSVGTASRNWRWRESCEHRPCS